jgi:hypothetical protein
MAIEFRCPCGQTLRAGEGLEGRAVRCSSCKTRVVVPGGVQPPALVVVAEDPGIVDPPVRLDQRRNASARNRSLATILVACLALAFAVASYFRPVKPAAKPGPFQETVVAHQFIVMNFKGDKAAEFGMMTDGWSNGLPAIKLYDAGKVRAEFCLMSNGRVLLSLKNRNEQSRASMFVLSSGDPNTMDDTQISVENRDGQTAINMRADANSSAISILDGDDRSRIQLYAPMKDSPPHNVPSIIVFDPKTSPIVTIPPPLKP